MSEPDTRGRIHEVHEENGHLSPTLSTGKEYPSRRRSASLAPSFRSGRSVHTVLEDKSKYFDEPPRTLKSRKTMGVKIKVSWWDLVKAFFSGPSKFAAKMASRIEPDTQEVDEKGEKRSPFKLIVSVFPRENPVPANHLHARCTLDTGCLQGNIVSLDFAERLGYKRGHFEELKPEEAAAGITALGNMVVPEGALRLSWYHSESSQVFTAMRFLVLEHTEVDLLVGVHSILQFNLILPPNFELQKRSKNGTHHVPKPDPQLLKVNQAIKHYNTGIEDLEDQRRPGQDNQTLEASIEEAKTKLAIAEKKRDLIRAKQHRKAHPSNRDMTKAVEDIEKNIEKLKKSLSKEGTEKAKSETKDKTKKDSKIEEKGLEIQLEEPNGEVREVKV